MSSPAGTVLRLTAGAVAVAAGVAGCGGGSGSGSHSPSASAGAGAGAAAAAVRQAWTTFFDGKTSVSRKEALLQDGQRFAALIRAQAGSGFATSVTAKVTSVTVHGSTATVVYTIDAGGQPALSNQHGQAVRQSGSWKVSVASFCSLLSLESGGTPPAGCPSASPSP